MIQKLIQWIIIYFGMMGLWLVAAIIIFFIINWTTKRSTWLSNKEAKEYVKNKFKDYETK
jgi:uncharacterized membrane protein